MIGIGTMNINIINSRCAVITVDNNKIYGKNILKITH